MVIGGPLALALIGFVGGGGGASYYSLTSVIFLIAKILIYLLILVYLVEAMQLGASGKEEAPPLSSLTEQVHDVEPLLYFLAAVALIAGPIVALRFLRIENAPFHAAVAFAFIYLPMAALATTLHNSPFAISPHIILPAILRTRGHYLAAMTAWAAMLISGLAIRRYMGAAGAFGSLMGNMVCLYLAAAGMRILGILYFCNSQKLNWFGEAE